MIFLLCLFFSLIGILLNKPFYELPEGKCTISAQINKVSDSSIRLTNVSFLQEGVWYRATGEHYLFLPDHSAVKELDYIGLNGINSKSSQLNFIRVFMENDFYSYPYDSSPAVQVKQYFNRYSSDFVDFIKESTNEKTGSFASGMFLGLGMSREIKKQINQSGISYLFVVSGFHFFITFYIFSYCLSFLKLRPKLSAILKMFFLILFYLICATGPSSFRAFLMLFLYQIFKLFDYPVSTLNVIGLSGIIILMVDPSIATNAGFQMTYGAVFGILLLSEILPQNKKWLSLLTPLGSLLFIIPITAWHFGTIPLLSIPVGFVLSITIIPLIMICMLLILLFYVLHLHFLVAILLKGLSPLLDLSSTLIRFLAEGPGTVQVEGIVQMTIICVFSGLILFLLLFLRKKKDSREMIAKEI